MSKLDKKWEKDFSAFERDLDVPEGKGAAADDLDFSYLEVDFSLKPPLKRYRQLQILKSFFHKYQRKSLLQ